jgi:EamA domain-containing membrane protein RarD
MPDVSTVDACREILHTAFGEAGTTRLLSAFTADFDDAIRTLNIAPMALGAVLVQVAAQSLRKNPQALMFELVSPGSITDIAVSLVIVGLTQQEQS